MEACLQEITFDSHRVRSRHGSGRITARFVYAY